MLCTIHFRIEGTSVICLYILPVDLDHSDALWVDFTVDGIYFNGNVSSKIDCSVTLQRLVKIVAFVVPTCNQAPRTLVDRRPRTIILIFVGWVWHIHEFYSNIGFLPPATVVAKVMFSQACVIPSVHWGGGGWLPSVHHWSHAEGGSASRVGGLHPMGRGSVCRRGHPGGGMHPWGVCIGQTPPSGYCGIWSTSSRYASYWNTFLFRYIFKNVWYV